MRWKYGLLVILVAAAFMGVLVYSQGRRTSELSAPEAVSFRILFGVGDKEPATWDGKVSLSGAGILSIQGWRFAGNDSSDYRSSWKAATRHGPPGAAAARRAGAQGPLLENGVLITAMLKDAQAAFRVETAQGNFSFTSQELPFGEAKQELQGRVMIERVPATTQLTTSDEEQDFPAVAQSGDDVYVAYVEFVHGDRSQARGPLSEEPKSFDFLARPVGGDQVRLMRYSKSKRAWSASEAVSERGQDVMRAAVAVDGKNRVWVIWSQNTNGNFDLYARRYERSQTGMSVPLMRLTSDAGTDVNPVATTDARGRVWVAWQAFRNNNLEILAMAQDGDKFGRETVVSSSRASDWDPAIAAAPNGEVAVSWDTYDKGDYDVYFRRLRYDGGVRMDAPVAVAASQNFEARSSIAYDPQNRLWAAYEAADVKWGKDFGAYETSGVSLYQGHNLRVKCFQGNNAFVTAADLAESLPGPMAVRPAAARRRAPSARSLPDASMAKERAPSATPQQLVGPVPRNSFPRIAVDSTGTVYLAVRTGQAARSPMGTVWAEEIVYFDGEKWSAPVSVPHTDNLLDSRPALISTAPGQLLMLAVSDHRQSQTPGGGRRAADAVNTDIYAAQMRLSEPPKAAKLRALEAEKVTPPQADVKPETDQVALMRDYRAAAGGEKLQLMRGEFHRHTEVSGDGGGDGPLIDAYRYMIDAAYMDWGGCCDHDNGGGREYSWWIEQKLTDAYHLGSRYVPMFSYERSVRYPEGHRNVVFPRRGIRPLPRLPKVADDAPPAPAPDTQMLYRYLKQFGGIVASHTSGTDMGTDWRDNDPVVEPVVEIYQGDRQNYEIPSAPRSNRDGDSIGGWRPLGFVSLALQKGYRLAFQASSDHVSTHMSYCNLWVTAPTREAIMEAFHKRRVYGATDNILADVRSGDHFMGEEFATKGAPSFSVKLRGTANFAKVHIIRNGEYVYTTEPNARSVDFTWKDSAPQKGKTSYYYVRGEQSDGELVWVSPMWIKVE